MTLFSQSQTTLATVLLMIATWTYPGQFFVTAESQDSLKQQHSRVPRTYKLNYDGSRPGLGNPVAGRQDSHQCGVYLALSTLPGTGVGMFAGRNFEEDEVLMSGDHNIPISDMEDHQPDITNFLWDQYTWNSNSVGMEHLGKYEVSVASPGFGAAANSFMDFVNVDEGKPEQGLGGSAASRPIYNDEEGIDDWDDVHEDAVLPLHRAYDPGVGAFTEYHSRLATASSKIEAGQELFVSYGSQWFRDRPWLGAIPVSGSHKKAEPVVRRLFNTMSFPDRILPIIDTLYETLVVGINDIWESRTIAALPQSANDAREFVSGEFKSLVAWRQRSLSRPVEWLEENGVCADNMYLDVSTIDQAGHGAFASRPLKKNSVILPIPLIHLPDRDVLDMYEYTPTDDEESDENYETINHDLKRGHQLLLNYVMGHRDSTMVLSPYGPAFNYINHNQTLANVKLQWADPAKSNHHPELLDKPVSEFHEIKSSSLAMELVTLRDIDVDEEIFLDYGDEWEEAWQKHDEEWMPVEDAEMYVSATQLNKSPIRLRTEFEQIEDPYPDNVVLYMNHAWQYERKEDQFFDPATITYETMTEYDYGEVEILRFELIDDDDDVENVDDPPDEEDVHIYYTVVVQDDKTKDDKLLEKVPRRAFKFFDREMTMDLHLINAFRHDMRIPDDIMPEAWKNLKYEEQEEEEEEESEGESVE